MEVKPERVYFTNSKPHRTKRIVELKLIWDTRVGEYVYRTSWGCVDNFSMEVLEDMINKLREKNK